MEIDASKDQRCDEGEIDEILNEIVALSEENCQLSSLDLVFRRFTNSSGVCDTNKLLQLLNGMGYTASEQYLDHALDIIDPHATGIIEKQAFSQWFEEHVDELGTVVCPSYDNKHGDDLADSGSATQCQSPSNLGRDKISQLSSPTYTGKLIDATTEEYNTLFAVKQSVKATQSHIQLLKNRLNRLRIEDIKTNRNIEEVQNRVKDLEALSARNREAKEKLKQRAAEIEEEFQESARLSRAKSMTSDSVKISILREKKQSADTLRQQREEGRQMIRSARNMEANSIKRRAQELRLKEQLVLAKRNSQKQAQKISMERQARDTLLNHCTSKVLNEILIDKLEKQEIELRAKLYKSQEIEREANKQLELLQKN